VAVNRGRKLNDADRRARDRLILAERSKGIPWAEVAAKFGLSETAARRGAANAARLAAEAGLAEIDAGKLLEDVVRAEARALYRLEELIMDDNAAVAVGACRAVGTVGAELRGSLVAAGLIPDGMETRVRAELRTAVRALISVGKRTGIDLREVQEAMAEEPALAGRVAP
jgi:hypothetical protein